MRTLEAVAAIQPMAPPKWPLFPGIQLAMAAATLTRYDGHSPECADGGCEKALQSRPQTS
jgi:hypothetical protein